MISISLENGMEIYPADDIKVTAEFYNPAFDKDRGERTYVYPMFIPASPDNNAGIMYLNRVDSEISLQDIGAIMYISGLPLYIGKLKINDNNPNGTNVEFVSAGRYILDHLAEVKISDVVDDIPIDVAGTHLSFFHPIYINHGDIDNPGPWSYQGDHVGIEIIIDGIPHEYVWIFGVDGDEDTDPYDVVSFLIDLINDDYPGLASFYEGGNGRPWLKINGLVVTIDAINAINMEVVQDEDIYTHAVLEMLQENIVDWIRDIIENGDTKICFPMIHATQFYDNKNPRFSGWVNYYLSSQVAQYNVTSEGIAGNWKWTYVPMMYFKYVMERIRTKMRISNYSGEPWEEPDMDQLIVYNDYAMDKEYNFYNALELDGSVTPWYYNALTTILYATKLLPNISAKDFIVGWLTMFNLHYRIRGESMIFYRNQTQLEGGCLDWTDKCEPYYEQEKQKNKGWSIDYVRDPQESFSQPEQLIKMTVGEVSRSITLPPFTLYMAKHPAELYVPEDDPVTDEVLTPTTGRPGHSDYFGTSAKDLPLKFLYYRGLQPSDTLGDYPMASHGWLNFEGTTVGDRSLGIQDNKGLYEKYWKGWVDMNEDDTFTVVARLTYADLKNITLWDNPKVTIVTDHGQANIIIKKIQTSFSNKGIGLSKVYGVRLK